MSDKERKAVENVVRGRQPVLVPLPVKHLFSILMHNAKSRFCANCVIATMNVIFSFESQQNILEKTL